VKQILAAIDFSASTAGVAMLAGELAAASEAEITLLHVAAPDPDFVGLDVGPQHVRDARARELQEERHELQRMSEELRSRGRNARGLVCEGPTVQTILVEAKKREADIIIVGSHGRGRVARALLGSVSSGVLKEATCPVVVVPCRPEP